MKVLYEGRKYGWVIKLHTQPPNSPDFNLLDLGLFRSLLSTTWDRDMMDIQDILTVAREAFNNLKPRTINDTILPLYQHMECSMMVMGGNNFKTPHMKKAKRRRCGEDLEVYTCSEQAFKISIEKLEEGN